MSLNSNPIQTAPFNNFGTAVPATFANPTAASSLIVAVITAQLASGTSTSVTDNVGNVYSMVPLTNPATSQRHKEIWYCLQATAGATTLNVNNAAGTNVVGNAYEWAGGAASLRASASLNNGSSTTPPAATATPSVGDLVIGGMGYQEATAGTRQDTLADVSYTAGTALIRGTNVVHVDAYKIATTVTATGPSWTMNPTVSTGEITAIFASPGGSATVTAVVGSAAASAPIPSVTGTTQVSGGGPGTASAASGVPVVTGGANVNAVASSGIANSSFPAVTAGVSVQATHAFGVAVAPGPVVIGGASIVAVRGSSNAQAGVASVNGGATVSSVVGAAAAGAGTPSLITGANVSATAGTAVCDISAPSVGAGAMGVIVATHGDASADFPTPVITGYIPANVNAVVGTAQADGIGNSIITTGATIMASAGASVGGVSEPVISGTAVITVLAGQATANDTAPSVGAVTVGSVLAVRGQATAKLNPPTLHATIVGRMTESPVYIAKNGAWVSLPVLHHW